MNEATVTLSAAEPAFTHLHAILLGAVQGLTEYLPVSSSAHLILVPRFLDIHDPGLAFDVFLHLGTLIATLLYFRADWLRLLRTLNPRRDLSRENLRAGAKSSLWILIAVATVPALVAGALLHSKIETVFRGNFVVANALVIGGLLLHFTDRYARNQKPLEELRLIDAIGIGIAQCFALVPGMSRSGSTLIGGRLMGLDRASAARFSFLISAPVTLAALIFELRKWNDLVAGVSSVTVLLAGAASAFVFGWLAIDGLLKLLRRFGFGVFAIYRIVLAAMIVKILGA